MAFHRIQKYSRQIVCQDCILSCQPNNIEEIPFLKRAKISGLSLQNKKTNQGIEGSIWVERDLDLSCMLLCWHLWNSRNIPSKKKKTDNLRQKTTGGRTKVLTPSLTLRGQTLYTSIEKYLLFLMPRDTKRDRTMYLPGERFSRRSCLSLSALYVFTALGLCQYKIKRASLQATFLSNLKNKKLFSTPRALSPERMRFASVEKVVQSIEPALTHPHFKKQDTLQDLSRHQGSSLAISCTETRSYKRAAHKDDCSSRFLRKNLSLHCPSVLSSPDIQDIAQSGRVTLEGSLTLELF